MNHRLLKRASNIASRLTAVYGMFLLLLAVTTARVALAQPATPAGHGLIIPTRETEAKVDRLIAEVLDPEISLELDARRSKLIHTKRPVERFSITNPEILEVVQFSPTEFELLGGRYGQTTLTLWFGDDTLRYLVRVSRDESVEDEVALEYGQLQRRINELFPNSMVQLIPIADKMIVRGQARDSEEASQILAIVGGQTVDQAGRQLGPGSYVDIGTAARPSLTASDLPASNVINLMDVPGEQQVMLKVRVAELSRSALRKIGAELTIDRGDFSWASLLASGGAFTAILETDDAVLALEAVSSNGYSKILAEPNLVTLNGRSASFLAGGEFAVPTVVGIDGAAAATTNFRGFGTQLFFTPTIIDKDRIRLNVTPSFSTLNPSNSVDGIPGLDSRTVTTTVDLREGQWLAIAGLLQDQQGGSKVRVPILGDIPILDTFFSSRSIKREESELVVLVSPELIHPLEEKEVPLVLPGMEVTEPTNLDFFFLGRYEGRPNCDYRSTVWPIQHDQMLHAGHDEILEMHMQPTFQDSEAFYVHGPQGFSD